MNLEEHLLWWLKTIGFVLFAMFGGVVGYVMRTLDKGKVKVKLGRALLEGIASGFVGLLFLLICQALNLGDLWTGVTVGMAGWLGANASIVIVEEIVYKRLGISKARRQKEAEDSQNADLPTR